MLGRVFTLIMIKVKRDVGSVHDRCSAGGSPYFENGASEAGEVVTVSSAKLTRD